jgi:DHA1 family bicyclomycin/chloramphenicol resistance-like MFS transporter
VRGFQAGKKISNNKTLRFGEFVSLMALLISLVALSIDAMLPALPAIGADLDVLHENGTQLVVTAMFVGFGIGQLFFGPISDSVGRKTPIYVGLGLFMLGSILAMSAWNFPVMLVGRILQGFGAAGPRTVTVALIRDEYEGRAMARIMSFVMAVFILVPMLAPALGQTVLLIANWRMIFALLLVLALIAFAWFGIRQPETLDRTSRTVFSVRQIGSDIAEVCRNRAALGYTISAGLVFGAFLGYLNSAQQIFQSQYSLGTQFPLYFAALAASLGCASLVNAKLVMHFGMRLLSWRALQSMSLVSIGYLIYVATIAGMPALWTMMTWGLVTFFSLGLVFGNFNAMAIESLGHIAGAAAAVIGSLATLISLLLGLLIGQSYNGTVLPLVGGFAILSLASLVAMHLTEKGMLANESGNR